MHEGELGLGGSGWLECMRGDGGLVGLAGLNARGGIGGGGGGAGWVWLV